MAGVESQENRLLQISQGNWKLAHIKDQSTILSGYHQNWFLVKAQPTSKPDINLIGYIVTEENVGFCRLEISIDSNAESKQPKWIPHHNHHILNLPEIDQISESQLEQTYKQLGLKFRGETAGWYSSAFGFGKASDLAIWRIRQKGEPQAEVISTLELSILSTVNFAKLALVHLGILTLPLNSKYYKDQNAPKLSEIF